MVTRTPRSLIALLSTLLVFFAVDRPAAAQNLHYGVNAHDISPQVAQRTTEVGAGIIRVVFGWDIIEPNCKGCFNWTITDAWLDQARRSNRVVFATLGYSPRWANGNHTYNYPPLRQQDWYDFVYAVVSRYRDDIYFWGVWNEPNLDSFLKDGDFDAYQQIAHTAHSAIRAANPDALVLGPDVSHHGIANGWFTTAMKAIGSLFDIVTVHWYADGPALESMMDDVVRPAAEFKSVWLTEVGRRPCDSPFGEAGQALFYDKVLRAFESRRDWWTAIIVYHLYDPPKPKDCGSGITRFDWSIRPAFTLYRQFIMTHP